MAKTAMQKLLANINNPRIEPDFDFVSKDNLVTWIKNYGLELEKQQIIDAYGKGFITATSLMDKKARGEYLNAEQYYNQTYLNETSN
jgi:hypothetical protein